MAYDCFTSLWREIAYIWKAKWTVIKVDLRIAVKGMFTNTARVTDERSWRSILGPLLMGAIFLSGSLDLHGKLPSLPPPPP